MASISNNNDFMVLELRDPLSSIDSSEISEKEIFISTTEISTWNLSSILNSQLIKVEADRNQLIQESSYFCGLLTGNFSESCLDCVSIEWKLESFINVLKSIYGFSSNVTAKNFILLLEGALFFGVETLLLECKAWLLETTYTTGVSSLHIDLDIIIEIWNFGFDHVDFIPELCTGYLARNFMLTMSCCSFANVPYKLLCHCIEHPQLTVDSEKHLAEALLAWLESKKTLLGCSSSNIEDACIDILQKVRARLLPIGFASGKRRSPYFSKLADKSISAILSLIKDPYMRDALKDGDLNDIRIRLTEFTEKIDLSGCPQMTLGFLLISVLPSYHNDPISRKKIKESLNDLEHLDRSPSQISQNLFPTLSFEAVREVDISNCPQLNLVAAIECFCNSFPSLRTLKASYLLRFRMSTLFHLVQKCPLVDEVDLTADLSPAVPTQVSTISTSVDGYRDLDAPSYKVLKERPLVSNLTKLTLEGRSDVNDLDLLNISAFSSSLSYLNLKGCTSVTDVGISKLICKCVNLKSINVSDTYFGRISIVALISDFPSSDDFPGVHGEHKYSDSLAFRLQKLDIGGCKSVDTPSLFQLMCHTYLLKSLCLRDTSIIDDALYNFLGSSLEMLDVSETMVSGAALAHIIRRNLGMKLLKARGCRNLSHRGSNIEATALPDKVLSYSDFSEVDELCVELGKNCILKEVAFGWGFHSLSLENLGPAIGSLRAITVSLGASLGEVTLKQLAKICPLLESVVLYFQEISDSLVISLVESLRHLQVLALCYCLGDLSSLSFNLSMPNLRTLKLERVAPWLTNDDLIILSQNCGSLAELSLSGCSLLNSDSQQIISYGWPGLISIHLEECGYVTSKGVSSLFDCKALESLLLRHNGRGIQRNFIVEASSKMSMLRKLALDLCDANEGGFDSPSYAERFNLRIVKIAKCKQQRCAFDLQNSEARRNVMLHKESIVLEWNSKELRTTIVKERV